MFASMAGILLLMIAGMIIVGIVTSSEPETTVEPNSIFVLRLNGQLVERADNNPLLQLIGEENEQIGLDDIITSIQKAKRHPDIKGLYLDLDGCTASYASASLQEIRRALQDFRKSGKFIVAYAGQYTQGGYYLATVANRIMLNPIGAVSWHGMSVQLMFLKETLAKVGIKMQVFRVGTYKSAVEPFISSEMSPANREQQQAIIDGCWNEMLTEVSKARKIEIPQLNALADSCMDFSAAADFVRTRMVDQLAYQDEVKAWLKHQLGLNAKEKLHLLTLDDMIYLGKQQSEDKDIVAVYYAYGEILDKAPGRLSENAIVTAEINRNLQKLADDDKVKAVVLRINSPGGSAYASEQIHRQIDLLKKKKPVVVSMGDYAASGGYYIASGAQKIVAESNTLTGSIGVFGLVPDVSELTTNKLGLHFDGVKTNKMADMGANMGRALNNEEGALVQQSVNRTYNLFIRRCAEGRGLAQGEIRKVAEGRVWTGRQALKHKLVDQLGGLNTAISIAAELAKLKDYTTSNYPERGGWMDYFINMNTDNYVQSQIDKTLGSEWYGSLKWLKRVAEQNRVQARIPYLLNFN